MVSRPSRTLLQSHQQHQSSFLPHDPQRTFAYDDSDAYTAAHAAAHAQLLGLPAPGSTGFGELDSDILMQADQIRRERLSKQRRQQEQHEAQMQALKEEKEKVVVGHLIDEDHVNYVLMYNMLTGIRIAVRTTLYLA